MTKVINGENASLGRLASYVAKESLKGEEIVVVNCENVIITGNKSQIREDYETKRRRVGSTQKGPKYSRSSQRIVKVAIRGMLPEHRWGRGRVAFKKIKCFNGVPKEFESAKKIDFDSGEKMKSIKVREIFIK